ncbi:hypothetical protein BJ508DRAFT_323072 [Ascobolus immersus RN42]|uniref:Uncharacterized protein n=1 Tax=Ascobolus immersus RN42 TaxID=1160509 RepID=A0A3N4IL68_ASCIM|nr:hypothetical protein BJ508DRAFT_323072 [Ascobolus immersus RN42]
MPSHSYEQAYQTLTANLMEAGQPLSLPRDFENTGYWRYIVDLELHPEKKYHICACYYHVDIRDGSTKHVKLDEVHASLLVKFMEFYGTYGGGDIEFTRAMTRRFLREVSTCTGRGRRFCERFVLRVASKMYRLGKKAREAGELEADPSSNDPSRPNIERKSATPTTTLGKLVAVFRNLELNEVPTAILVLRSLFPDDFDPYVLATTREALRAEAEKTNRSYLIENQTNGLLPNMEGYCPPITEEEIQDAIRRYHVPFEQLDLQVSGVSTEPIEYVRFDVPDEPKEGWKSLEEMWNESANPTHRRGTTRERSPSVSR